VIDMARSKEMGLGAMFVLLVVVIVALPMVMRFVSRMDAPFYAMDGFQNAPMTDEQGVADIPAIGRSSKLPTWRPDRNTDYLCRSPNEDGMPCPEGQFCDGSDQRCKPVYVGGAVPNMGYFS
jgi:hypothetical protein